METRVRPFPCSGCGAPTVQITIEVGRKQATMRSCSTCDHRSWHALGEPVELEGVLAGLAVSRSR